MSRVKLVCLACAAAWEVPEGTSLSGVSCPACGTLQASHFTHAKSIQFRSLESASYQEACDRARRGDREAALLALEAALKEGFDLELVEHDPALASLRTDPRFAPLLKRYRPA